MGAWTPAASSFRSVCASASAASAASAAALSLAIANSSAASSSASGESSIVSNDAMLGLLERKEVGVDGIDEAAEIAELGKGSLKRGVDPDGGLEGKVSVDERVDCWWSGEIGRRRPLLERWKETLLAGRADEGIMGGEVKSTSASSAMLSISRKPAPEEDAGRVSSSDLRGVMRDGGGLRGDEGRTGEVDIEPDQCENATVGTLRLRAIGGAERLWADCEREWPLDRGERVRAG